MNKNNDGKNNNKCSSSINLTIKFRDATNSIRDELLPPECLLLIQKKDKSIKKVVESDVYTLSNDDKHEQRAVFDSLPASPTSPFSPQTPSSQESMSLSPHNRFVGNNSKVGSVDYTTQLHQLCAMSSSNLDIIQIILSSSPMAARCRDKAGNLPLHVLLCQEDPNPQLVLVVLQANSSAARVRSSIGSYPLFQACRLPKAHPSIIKMLLQSYPESIHCKVYGSTPLHALTHAGCTNAESLRVLLALNSDLAAQVNNTGNLPLHYVAANVESVGSSDCVRLLLSAYPAGATVRNKSGQTPVQRVQSRWDHTSILSELTLSLRLLLRYVPPVKLVTQEQTDLYQLNWLCRRDIVMARCMANQKCLQNSVLVDVCAVKDNVGIEDQESDNIISRDMQVFSNIVMRLDCEEIWRHIVSYI